MVRNFLISTVTTLCLSTIDHCGDHLECAHGPMHIHRHDALVDIVYHACLRVILGFLRSSGFQVMITPTPEMFTTQIFSMAVLHALKFQFAALLRLHTFHPLVPGIAAAARELTKDERRRDFVEDAGCDFIPLVMETFGVWSPFVLQVIYSIADHTTARSGASTRVARKNLLQQLSVLCHFGPPMPE